MRVLLAVCLFALMWAACPAAAQILVDVRARATISDVQIRDTGGVRTLTGTLRDDLGRGVPHAVMQLGDRQFTTQAGGRFELDLPESIEAALNITYAGSPLLGACEATLAAPKARAAIGLTLVLSPRLAAGRPLSVTVEARNLAGQPEGDLPLQWRLDGAVPALARLDQRGQSVLTLPALTAGTHTIAVTTSGDRRRLSQSIERTFEVAQPMGVTLTASVSPNAEQIRVSGVLRPGPAGTEITIVANGLAVERRATAEDGTFSAVLMASDFEAGTLSLRVLAHASQAGWLDAASEVAQVRLMEPLESTTPVWAWAPAALAALALLLVALHLAYRAEPTVQARRPSAVPPPLSYDTLDAPETTLQVTVLNALSSTPINAWLVTLPSEAADPAPGQTDPPPGELVHAGLEGHLYPSAPQRVWAYADGYAPLVVELLRGGRATLRLMPARAHIQQVFDQTLQHAGRPALQFGRETPREAGQAFIERGVLPEDAHALTRLVEIACYGAEAPQAEHLQQLHLLAQRVTHGLASR
jgi:hypothetical protein